MGKLFRKLILATLVLSAACTTSQTNVPPLSGPSELALSLRLVAVPDSITQDGASQASIEVTAFDANGKTCAGLPVRLDMAVGGAIQDFGTLSARTIVTASDGKARAIYTAAPPPSSTAGGSGTTVLILATPSSSVNCGSNQAVGNFDGANRQQVAIRLIPPGVVVAPAVTPTARFTFSTPVSINTATSFDGSSSCPGALNSAGSCAPSSTAASTITSYAWRFGDGGTGTGQIASHTFTSVGTFTVTLTVTNDRGVTGSSSQTITTELSAAPTGDFAVSPSNPVIGSGVLFNADGITAAPGHAITSYAWDFGDPSPGAQGNSGSGPHVSHVYNAAGGYNVVLTVTDDTGQRKTFTKAVAVASGQPKAAFAFANLGGQMIGVDGSGSTAAGTAVIQTYAWTWGDASSNSPSTSPVATHQYLVGATYTVTLTVTDNLGRVGTVSQAVTVP